MCTIKIFVRGRHSQALGREHSPFSSRNIQQTEPPSRLKTVGNFLALSGLWRDLTYPSSPDLTQQSSCSQLLGVGAEHQSLPWWFRILTAAAQHSTLTRHLPHCLPSEPPGSPSGTQSCQAARGADSRLADTARPPSHSLGSDMRGHGQRLLSAISTIKIREKSHLCFAI